MINDPYSNTPTPNPARRTQSGGYGQLHPAVTQRFRSRMMNYGRPQNSPGGGITPPGPKQQWDPENPGPKRYPPGFDPIGPSGGLGGPQGPTPPGPWTPPPADRPDVIMPGPPQSYGPVDGPNDGGGTWHDQTPNPQPLGPTPWGGGGRPQGQIDQNLMRQFSGQTNLAGMNQGFMPMGLGGNYGGPTPPPNDGGGNWRDQNPTPQPLGPMGGGQLGITGQNLAGYIPGQPLSLPFFDIQQPEPLPPNPMAPPLRRRINEDRFGEGSRPLISGPSGWQW